MASQRLKRVVACLGVAFILGASVAPAAHAGKSGGKKATTGGRKWK